MSLANQTCWVVGGVGVIGCLLHICVQQRAGDARPCKQVTSLIQSSEETVLLAPYQVFLLLAHADKVGQVLVRVRYNLDIAEVRQESHPVGEPAGV